MCAHAYVSKRGKHPGCHPHPSLPGPRELPGEETTACPVSPSSRATSTTSGSSSATTGSSDRVSSLRPSFRISRTCSGTTSIHPRRSGWRQELLSAHTTFGHERPRAAGPGTGAARTAACAPPTLRPGTSLATGSSRSCHRRGRELSHPEAPFSILL